MSLFNTLWAWNPEPGSKSRRSWIRIVKEILGHSCIEHFCWSSIQTSIKQEIASKMYTSGEHEPAVTKLTDNWAKSQNLTCRKRLMKLDQNLRYRVTAFYKKFKSKKGPYDFPLWWSRPTDTIYFFIKCQKVTKTSKMSFFCRS